MVETTASSSVPSTRRMSSRTSRPTTKALESRDYVAGASRVTEKKASPSKEPKEKIFIRIPKWALQKQLQELQGKKPILCLYLENDPNADIISSPPRKLPIKKPILRITMKNHPKPTLASPPPISLDSDSTIYSPPFSGSQDTTLANSDSSSPPPNVKFSNGNSVCDEWLDKQDMLAKQARKEVAEKIEAAETLLKLSRDG